MQDSMLMLGMMVGGGLVALSAAVGYYFGYGVGGRDAYRAMADRTRKP